MLLLYKGFKNWTKLGMGNDKKEENGFLLLTLKHGQGIVFSNDITIFVAKIRSRGKHSDAKLAIRCDKSIQVTRTQLLECKSENENEEYLIPREEKNGNF